MNEGDEAARQDALARVQALQNRINDMHAKLVAPDDPDKTVFGRIWDSIRGGTDRVLNVKRIAKKARQTETIDHSVVEPLGSTIKKGDVSWLVNAYRKSCSEYEKVVLMNVMLAYPFWIPMDLMIDHLNLELVDNLQTVQVGILLRFLRNQAETKDNPTITLSKSDEQIATIKAAQARLETWVDEERLSRLEANLIPEEPWPPRNE